MLYFCQEFLWNEHKFGHSSHDEYEEEYQDEDEYDAANRNEMLPICWSLRRRNQSRGGGRRPPLDEAPEDLRLINGKPVILEVAPENVHQPDESAARDMGQLRRRAPDVLAGWAGVRLSLTPVQAVKELHLGLAGCCCSKTSDARGRAERRQLWPAGQAALLSGSGMSVPLSAWQTPIQLVKS
jgi:hypothetical protein